MHGKLCGKPNNSDSQQRNTSPIKGAQFLPDTPGFHTKISQNNLKLSTNTETLARSKYFSTGISDSLSTEIINHGAYAINDTNSITSDPTISQDPLHLKPDILNDIVNKCPNPITTDLPIKSRTEGQAKTNQTKILIISQPQ